MSKPNFHHPVALAMQRVSVYIDGFNLYYGLKSKGWRRYYWLDLCRLSENLLRPGQRLVRVRYFTTRISPQSGNSARRKRQNTYLEALETLSDLHIHYGHFLPKNRSCSQCGAVEETYEEKMTDVNIAVELLGDAQDNAFDTAIIVSGDSDLTSPTSAVRHRYPAKRVVVAFPPNRVSKQLCQTATSWFTIGRRVISDSQLPERVAKTDGYVLRKPSQWR